MIFVILEQKSFLGKSNSGNLEYQNVFVKTFFFSYLSNIILSAFSY